MLWISALRNSCELPVFASETQMRKLLFDRSSISKKKHYNCLFISFDGSKFHYRSQVCWYSPNPSFEYEQKTRDSALKSIIFSVAHSYKRFQYEILLVVFTIARRYRSTAFCLSILSKKTLNKTFL